MKIGFFDGTEYFFLSNFYPAPIFYMGRMYKTTEHLFQSMKALNDSDSAEIRHTPQPGSAKRLGGSILCRGDWDQVKDKVMLHACLCKFLQHADLAERLLATGDAYLEEGNTWGDKYWGVVDGVGKNMLGKTLMQVRDILKLQGISEEEHRRLVALDIQDQTGWPKDE
jgi:hypothetical protein